MNKEKLKKYGLWALGIFVAFGVLGALLEEDETKVQIQETTSSETVDLSPQDAPETEQTIWTIDADDSEFEGYSDSSIAVLNDPDNPLDRTGKVNRYDKVEFIEQHSGELYCKIKKENIEGFIACSWLKEAPQEWKDLWKF